MKAPCYTKWFVEESSVRLKDGTNIPCFRLDHTQDEDTLNEWALHLRRHYIDDAKLEQSLKDLHLSAAEYLRDYILPGGKDLGAACRSGDFTEILTSDLLEYIYNYIVPRCKQYNRPNKDRSTQGTDVIGYRYENPDGTPSIDDKLIAAEVKGALSTGTYNVLKNAADGSQADSFRLSTTLDFCRKQLIDRGKDEEAKKLARFLCKSEMQYKTYYLGVGVASINSIDDDVIPDYCKDDLMLDVQHAVIFIHGEKLMKLANNLFERCMR